MRLTQVIFGMGAVALLSTGLDAHCDDIDPVVLRQTRPVGVCLNREGGFSYYLAEDPKSAPELPRVGGGSVVLAPRLELEGDDLAPLPTRLVAGTDGELHAVLMKRRGKSGRPAAGIFIDLWHRQTVDGRRRWAPERCIWEGYTGAVMMRTRLRSGRLLVPFGKWIPNRPVAPPTGCHITTALYSDDNGATWTLSEAALTSPCVEDYNGNNYGACEPVVVELETNDHLYMLMRTQAGFLYESQSTDGGATWSEAVPSRFHVSTGPPGIVGLQDGRMVVVWNNCAMPPRLDGQGVYGGRDALHAAISEDNGRTWQGFREIYRDLARNETPPKRGDRGTAYPYVSVDGDGYLVVESGQGAGRRNFLRFHPDFLLQRTAADDFSGGLDAWHVFKPFGPARGYWRDRTVGPVLRPHPDDPDQTVLWVRHDSAHEPDGATWNFPLGWSGEMLLEVQLREGTPGMIVSLGDRMFEPTDSNGDDLAMFGVRLVPPSQGAESAGRVALPTGTWHTLRLRWNLDEPACVVSHNGRDLATLPLRHRTLNGLSYLRLRSAARERDQAGAYINRVAVTVDKPLTPPAPLSERRSLQARFFEVMAPRRNRVTAEALPGEPDRPADPRLPAPQG